MKQIIGALAIASTMLAVPAFAQDKPQDKPNVQAPSGQNSGPGVQGYPGNKNGPPANQATVGSNAGTNPGMQSDDATNVKGLPGNKNGPPAKKPSESNPR
jgi:hypothetical protein